ncbi:MAG: hypothetical protein IKS83_03475 [Victivallales bacterium]|nr:hypothetical protein [Victivallales bacterium]
MSNITQCNRQCCFTCQFWTGERRIIQNGRLVETPSNEFKPCNAGKGARLGVGHGCSCKEYRRWVNLP